MPKKGKEQMLGSELVKDKDYLNKRMSSLSTEYETFEAHYKELSEFMEPRRGRFFTQDVNKGDKRYKNIINSKATSSLRKATAGMLAGVMSPSRPWFAYTMLDKAVLNDPDVKKWLALLRDIVLMVFNASNLYNMAPSMIKELLLFGVGCMTQDEDFDDISRFYTHTVGSYVIAQNDKLQVSTLARKFQWTCQQIVAKFGIDNVSASIKNNYNRSNYNAPHVINHLIEINPLRDDEEAKFSSEFQRFRSVYWETGGEKGQFLRRSGYRGFPAYVPRWELTGADVYATNCPGMTALGDVKMLQVQEKELARAKAKAGSPVLQGPPGMRNKTIPNLPGGVAINTTTNAKIEPIYNVDPRVQEHLMDIERTEHRIDDVFFIDLFLAITNIRGIQPKNEMQLAQVDEERLLQLGPVLEQLHGEWLARMVSRTTGQVLDAGIMPDAPDKLIGKELDIHFISALAQAQRAVATSAIERTVFFAGSLTESGWAGALDKVDPDYAMDTYSELVGAPPELIIPTEEAQRRREEARKAAEQQAQLEAAQQAANTAKMAADAKLGDDNLLSKTLEGR